MGGRNSKSTITDLITSRAEDLDFAGVDAGEGLLLEWVAEGDDSLSFAISFLSSLLRPRGLGDGWWIEESWRREFTYSDLSLSTGWNIADSIMHNHSSLRITAQENPRIWTKRSSFADLSNSNCSTRTSERGNASDVGLVVDTLEQKLPRCQLLQLSVQAWADRGSDVTSLGSSASEKKNIGLARLLGGDVVGSAGTSKTAT